MTDDTRWKVSCAQANSRAKMRWACLEPWTAERKSKIPALCLDIFASVNARLGCRFCASVCVCVCVDTCSWFVCIQLVGIFFPLQILSESADLVGLEFLFFVTWLDNDEYQNKFLWTGPCFAVVYVQTLDSLREHCVLVLPVHMNSMRGMPI